MTKPEAEIVSAEKSSWDKDYNPKVGTKWGARYIVIAKEYQPHTEYTVFEVAKGFIRIHSNTGDILTMDRFTFDSNFLPYLQE